MNARSDAQLAGGGLSDGFVVPAKRVCVARRAPVHAPRPPAVVRVENGAYATYTNVVIVAGIAAVGRKRWGLAEIANAVGGSVNEQAYPRMLMYVETDEGHIVCVMVFRAAGSADMLGRMVCAGARDEREAIAAIRAAAAHIGACIGIPMVTQPPVICNIVTRIDLQCTLDLPAVAAATSSMYSTYRKNVFPGLHMVIHPKRPIERLRTEPSSSSDYGHGSFAIQAFSSGMVIALGNHTHEQVAMAVRLVRETFDRVLAHIDASRALDRVVAERTPGARLTGAYRSAHGDDVLLHVGQPVPAGDAAAFAAQYGEDVDDFVDDLLGTASGPRDLDGAALVSQLSQYVMRDHDLRTAAIAATPAADDTR